MAIGTTAALIGSAVIGAGSSIIAGNKAAGAAKDAAAQSAAIQKYQYDTTRADYEPYRKVGYSALGKLAGLSGLDVPDAINTDWEAYARSNPGIADYYLSHNGRDLFSKGDSMSLADYGKAHYDAYGASHGINLSPYQTKTSAGSGTDPYADFYNSPGYLFRLKEGQKAIERSAAARGGLYSGATMKAIDTHAQGVASDEFGNYVNRLQSLAGVGQSATGSTAAAGQAYASGASQAAQQAGAARASAYANTGQAINTAVGGLAGGLLYQQGMKAGGGAQYPYGGTLGGIY